MNAKPPCSVAQPMRVVVIGNGMVGHRFVERLVELDAGRRYKVTVFCEEPRPAYDRVALTSYFAHRDAERLRIADRAWYEERGVDLRIGDRALAIDRERRLVASARGDLIPYERIVLATGSHPFVPPVPGIRKTGVFVYRTIEDLEEIADYAKRAATAAVLGGGLLGLEAAKAARDLGLETHVVEFAPRLMPRQVDDAGSRLLAGKIEELGVRVHLGKRTQEVLGNGKVDGLLFDDGGSLALDMVIISAGIRPRDELARECGLEVGERGGVVVDDFLRTSDPDIYAVGEVALHRGTVYGLVGPGYEMAEVAAAHLAADEPRAFRGGDLSAKLKLMGVDVASFGRSSPEEGSSRAVVWEDPFAGVYRKLVFSADGTRLLGGILVGDASDYGRLLALWRTGEAVPVPPGVLAAGAPGTNAGTPIGCDAADAQVCSCNNVGAARIRQAIREGSACTIGELKTLTRAGTGCGGCIPLLSDLLKEELEAAGKAVSAHICEHFPYTRQELLEIVKVREIRTFDELIGRHGVGTGCEVCKPAVASILASLWNEHVLDHATLQDTNDRFLANLQRGGLYSVVPRVPGGEITPEKLVVLGEVAKEFGLYTKITGGQRIDLFGAELHELPEIWERLIDAGFESGHAYGKALRTVKSCVGTTWCRYGVQDSVAFAIRVEERYRGIRAPHKIKGAVSGCVRECAEAQGKDFGLVATEKGYNLYVCGNGGAKPRHADLLASDIDEETAIRYLDRFLMYYILTADKLTRTSVWLEKLEGGLEHIRDVVVNDKLGICDELERRMEHLVSTYRCEWKEVVRSPEKRKLFRQFANAEDSEPGIELVDERGHKRPADWPRGVVPVDSITLPDGKTLGGAAEDRTRRWVEVGRVSDFPRDGGQAIRYGGTEIAVYNLRSRGEWFATQNMCPHRNAFVLARGLTGDQAGEPKVACPLHKKTFSLATGECLSGDPLSLETFPVKVEGEKVLLALPPVEALDRRLATRRRRIGAPPCAAVPEAGSPAAATCSMMPS